MQVETANDLTIYLQTLDGEVSFTAAAQFVLGGGGFARFTLPADAQTLLDNLASGDRWIFKTARPAAVTPTDQPITAEGRHDTRGKTTVSEEAPSSATDQPITAEGRHATRGEAAVSEEAVTPATDQTITAEGRHATRSAATVEDVAPPTSGPLRDLRVSVGGRDYSDHIERGWRIIRRTGVRSEATFQIVALPGEITLPKNGEEVIATATGGGAVSLFGGYLDEPELDSYTGSVGLYALNLQAIGFRARLDDVLLSQAEGIDIVQEATAVDQIEALIDAALRRGLHRGCHAPGDGQPGPRRECACSTSARSSTASAP